MYIYLLRRKKSSRDACGRATRVRLSPLASRLSLGEYPLQREHESFNLVFRVVMRERDSNDALPRLYSQIFAQTHPVHVAVSNRHRILPSPPRRRRSATRSRARRDERHRRNANRRVGTRRSRIRIAQRSRSDTAPPSRAARAPLSALTRSNATSTSARFNARPPSSPKSSSPRVSSSPCSSPADREASGYPPMATIPAHSSCAGPPPSSCLRIISRVDEIVVGSLHGGESSIRPEERARVRARRSCTD